MSGTGPSSGWFVVVVDELDRHAVLGWSFGVFARRATVAVGSDARSCRRSAAALPQSWIWTAQVMPPPPQVLIEARDGLVGGGRAASRRGSLVPYDGRRQGHRCRPGALGRGAGHVLLEREDEPEVDDAEHDRQQQHGDEGELEDRGALVALAAACARPLSSSAHASWSLQLARAADRPRGVPAHGAAEPLVRGDLPARTQWVGSSETGIGQIGAAKHHGAIGWFSDGLFGLVRARAEGGQVRGDRAGRW